MTRLLMDAVLIVSVTASVIATAGAFDSLGHRAPPAPKLDQPSRTAEVEQPPAFPIPEGGIVTTRRVIVRVVEVDPGRSTTAQEPVDRKFDRPQVGLVREQGNWERPFTEAAH